MGLETALPAYLRTLVATNPDGADGRSTADDHLRYFKRAVQTQFAGLAGTFTAADSVTATFGRMNDVFVNAVMNNAANTMSGGTIDMAGNIIDNAKLQSYAEVFVSKGATSTEASATLDYSVANNFAMTVAANDLTVTFASWPASGIQGTITLDVTQDGTGSRDINLPPAVKWSGGVYPPMSQLAGTISTYAFSTKDGGTTVMGYQTGFDMS